VERKSDPSERKEREFQQKVFISRKGGEKSFGGDRKRKWTKGGNRARPEKRKRARKNLWKKGTSAHKGKERETTVPIVRRKRKGERGTTDFFYEAEVSIVLEKQLRNPKGRKRADTRNQKRKEEQSARSGVPLVE